MIKVAALTSGKDVPSTRFRVRQHIESLRMYGIDVTEYTPIIDKYYAPPFLQHVTKKKYLLPAYALCQAIKLTTRFSGLKGSWNSEITWLERELLPGILTLEPLLKKPYVFDIDDAIWLNGGLARSTVIKIARNAEVVLAGNNYIAEWASSYAQDVRVVPTAIDTDRFMPLNNNDEILSTDRFVIGWTGTSSNFKYLYSIEKALDKFLRTYNAEILIVADQSPVFNTLPADKLHYMNWSPSIEAEAVRKMNVGLMPLPADEWARGKCSFKMLQYMGCGIPVVVSPVGMNAEVLALGNLGFAAEKDEDWYEALVSLYQDRVLCHSLGAEGRLVVERHFSRNVVSQKIAKVFKELS